MRLNIFEDDDVVHIAVFHYPGPDVWTDYQGNLIPRHFTRTACGITFGGDGPTPGILDEINCPVCQGTLGYKQAKVVAQLEVEA